MHRDLILGLNWQFSYKIGCNWNMNWHQYMTNNSNYLCTSILSKVTKHIIWNAGAFYLKARSVSSITDQATIALKPKHICGFNAHDDLPDGLIPLAVEHMVNHKYPNLLWIPVPIQHTTRFTYQDQLYVIHLNLLI